MELRTRVSCSMCIRRIWASQKTLHISVLPWSWRTLLAPRWSQKTVVPPDGDGPSTSAGGFFWIWVWSFSRSSHHNSCSDDGFANIAKKPLCLFFFLLRTVIWWRILNFQYKCYPRHLENRNWGRRLILPETMNCRNCPAYEVLKGGVFFAPPKAAWLVNNHLPGIWAEWDLSKSTRVHARLLCLHVSCRDSFFGGWWCWWCGDVAWKVTLKLPATGLISSLLWHSLADM